MESNDTLYCIFQDPEVHLFERLNYTIKYFYYFEYRER
ncbi:hypothetical protein DYBT9275_06095 [Dyadobacter sp. CECT 9275]|uniref:Uncharacterized protein n=1 Tax=Dyadobacter helix TaxID=2822344 RepID=A0A916N7X9_9BACT|nr:hypothetical protein DYBT9275_06095 [Dyadobacter sp. CECT 9275]